MPLDIRVNTAHEGEATTRTKTLGNYVDTIKKTNKKWVTYCLFRQRLWGRYWPYLYLCCFFSETHPILERVISS